MLIRSQNKPLSPMAGLVALELPHTYHNRKSMCTTVQVDVTLEEPVGFQPGCCSSGSFVSLTGPGGKSQRDHIASCKLMRGIYSFIQRAASLNTMQVASYQSLILPFVLCVGKVVSLGFRYSYRKLVWEFRTQNLFTREIFRHSNYARTRRHPQKYCSCTILSLFIQDLTLRR